MILVTLPYGRRNLVCCKASAFYSSRLLHDVQDHYKCRFSYTLCALEIGSSSNPSLNSIGYKILQIRHQNCVVVSYSQRSRLYDKQASSLNLFGRTRIRRYFKRDVIKITGVDNGSIAYISETAAVCLLAVRATRWSIYRLVQCR